MTIRHGFMMWAFSMIVGLSPGKTAAQSCAESNLRDYLEGGGYVTAVSQVTLAGQFFLRRAANEFPGESLALVLDMDDTAVTNTAILDEDAFCFNDARMIAECR